MSGCAAEDDEKNEIVSKLSAPFIIEAQTASLSFELCVVGDSTLYTFTSPDELRGLSVEKLNGEVVSAVYGGIQTTLAPVALRVPDGLAEAVELVSERLVSDGILTEKADSGVSVYSLAIDGRAVMLYYNHYDGLIESITYMKDGKKTEYILTDIREVVT